MAMSLKQRIVDDMKSAMKARDSRRLSAIRLLLAAIKQREVDERTELDDAAVTAVVERAVKQRRDAAAQFADAGRDELAAAEKFEIEVLGAYLPEQLDDAAIEAAIATAVADTGSSGPADMGRLMAALKPVLAGRADMARVSSLARKALASRC
ncbi:MAG: GatB/YqeY domain-containing protein [Rhodocyclaceae bacterium]|nr:GatB/YqeY domain-containing protein [Rhodocyclaceae bacterium]